MRCRYDTYKRKDDKRREELTFSSCTSLDDVTPWCYTRIQVGEVYFPHGRKGDEKMETPEIALERRKRDENGSEEKSTKDGRTTNEEEKRHQRCR